jgi:hypothetical protein
MRGLNDKYHYDKITETKGRWNKHLNSYHNKDNKCSDDDDDFRFLRNVGNQWVNLPLPEPAIPDWKVCRLVQADATAVPVVTQEQQAALAAGMGAGLLLVIMLLLPIP